MPNIQDIDRAFSRGVNMREDPSEVEKSALQGCTNMVLDPAGGLVIRKGFYNYFDVSSLIQETYAKIVHIGRFRSSDGTIYPVIIFMDCDGGYEPVTLRMAYYSAGSLTEITIPEDTPADKFIGMEYTTTAEDFHTFMSGDFLIILNGTDPPACWDGSNDLAILGVLNYEKALTSLTETTGGSVDEGFYWYAYALKNSTTGHISKVYKHTSPVEVTTGNNQIDVVVTAADDDTLYPGTDKMILYRSAMQATNDEPPISQYYFLSEEAFVGASITYNDTDSDATVTSNATLLSEHPLGWDDHGLPPAQGGKGCTHKSRVFMNDTTAGEESKLWYSRPNKEAYFPEDHYQEIYRGDGDTIDHMCDLEVSLEVFKTNSNIALDTHGPDHVHWEIRKISKIGIIATKTLCTFQNPTTGRLVAARLALSGVYMTDGESDIEMGERVWASMVDIGLSDIVKFSAYYNPKEEFYIIEGLPYTQPMDSKRRGLDLPPPTEYQLNGLVFHLRKPVYTQEGDVQKFDGFAATLTTSAFTHHNDDVTDADQLFYGAKGGDTVYVIWSGDNDDGSGINISITPRMFILGGDKIKAGKALKLMMRYIGLNAACDLYYNIDQGSVIGSFRNISNDQADTFMDQNIFDKLAAPTLSVQAGGSLAAGDYYYRYRYSDDTNPVSATIITEASEDSAKGTTAGGNLTLRVTIPAYGDPDQAYNKYYNSGDGRVIIYRSDDGATGPFYFVQSIAMVENASTYWDDTGATQNELYQLLDPVDEIEWAEVVVKNSWLPSKRGRMKTKAKGELISLTLVDYNQDGITDSDFRVIAMGCESLPKESS